MESSRPMEPLEVYKQQYAHFGRLNETLYKMPSVFAAVIGGLWYFAAGYLEKDRLIAAVVFAFSGAIGAASAVAVYRFRLAFKGYIDGINAFDGPFKVKVESRVPSTLRAMTWVMCLAIAVSLGGAVYAALKRSPAPERVSHTDGNGVTHMALRRPSIAATLFPDAEGEGTRGRAG